MSIMDVPSAGLRDRARPGDIRPNRANLRSIQALRAVAAMLVVVYHVVALWWARTGGDGELWINGSAGVDIFFVISGVVMAVSTQGRVAGARAAGTFMLHRVLRVIPLYWLVTTIKISTVLALPHLVTRTQLGWTYVLSSYLLLPLQDDAGDFKPVLPVGWTLTYEMAFYVLVALALCFRVSILRVAVPVFGAIIVFSGLRGAAWPGVISPDDPIVVEFIYGVVLAKLMFSGRVLPSAAAAIAVVAGFVMILVVPAGPPILRPLAWGIPAAMIVAGALGLEAAVARRIPGWLLLSGNASYAIYLTHGFVLPLAVLAAAKVGGAGYASLIVAILAGSAISIVAGWGVHLALERPMLRSFLRRPLVLSPAVVR